MRGEQQLPYFFRQQLCHRSSFVIGALTLFSHPKKTNNESSKIPIQLLL
jgi:hypothetical protein